MGELRVWAPNAHRVAVHLDSHLIPMHRRGNRGWWSVEAVEIRPGIDYAFQLDDDGQPLPDPRSGWQPHGVHGPSRMVDHRSFTWTDQEFVAPPLADAVIYELHVGTFTTEGTFDAIIERLDHLMDLGITHIELMPVAHYAGDRGWGYDGVNLFAPHHAYGGPEGLKRLVNAFHARGLAVLLDVVYNHFGPSGNYLPRFGPYLTDRYATPWGSAVNFDGRGSDQVRALVCANAFTWMSDYHFDGLRLDAVHAIPDYSPTHLLEELAAQTEKLARQTGRRLVLIAEDDRNDPRVVTPITRGGFGINAVWNEDFHHALHAVLTGERTGYYGDYGSLAHLAKVLSRGFAYDGQFSVYRGRRQGRAASHLLSHQFVGCLQNHDQVGNRAIGDRISHLVSFDRLRVGVAMLLTSPFVPMLFAGEEWAASSPFQYFTDHQEPDLAHAVTEGRKREFAASGWAAENIPDPQDPATFERSKLDWSEIAREPHRDVLEWYRNLIRLRASAQALRSDKLDTIEVAFDEDDRWFVMTRPPITVAFNLGSRPRLIPLSGESHTLLLASRNDVRIDGSGLQLPAESIAIIRTDSHHTVCQ